MANATGMAAVETATAIDPYQAAEQELWRAYGLEPVERWVDLHEPAVRIRVLDIGSGDPVVFIGGTGGTGAAWAPLVAGLPDRRSIVVDRPGWGLSGSVDYRGADFGTLVARIVEGVLDGLDLERVDLVGASIGGLWALHAARRIPARVGRLVLIGGMPNRDVPLPTFIKLLRSPLGAVMVRLPMGPGMIRKQLEALGHGATLSRGGMSDYIAWRLAFQRGTDSMAHERDMVRAITTADGFRPGVLPSDAEQRDVRQPTLVVFGSSDPTGSTELWQRFAGQLPDGSFHVVEGGGHNPYWDAPSEVSQLVGRFLAGVR